MRQRDPRLGLALVLAHAELAVAFAATLAFAAFAAELRVIATDGKAFDLMFTGYTPTFVYEELGRWQARGRELYWTLNLIDFFYAVVYTTAVAIALGQLTPHLVRWRQLRRLILAVPLVGGALDLAENSLLRSALLAYPARVPDPIISVASIVTTMKWLVVGIAVVFALIALAWAAAKFARATQGPGVGDARADI